MSRLADHAGNLGNAKSRKKYFKNNILKPGACTPDPAEHTHGKFATGVQPPIRAHT